MANFDAAIPTVFKNEGGYVNDPNDPGGETKFGISKRSYPNLNISALTVDQAKAIYKRDYWRYDGIQDQAIATKVFDLAVNCGSNKAIRLLQQAINSSGMAIQVDGFLGLTTLMACNSVDPEVLLACLKIQAVAHYRSLVEAWPRLAKFLPGWTKRAQS